MAGGKGPTQKIGGASQFQTTVLATMGKKTMFLSTFDTKRAISLRQARDKHRQNLTTHTF